MTQQCGAKTRSGALCKARAMPNGRCRMHGGKSLAGVEAPNYRTGKYSAYLPERLLQRYHEAAEDPRLLELQHEIALLDGRLADLLGRVDTGEAGQTWRLAKAALSAYEETREDDELSAARHLATLRELLGKGAADYAAWAEVFALVEQRRKLVESERKRLVETQQTITVERAMLIIGGLTDIIRRHVPDPAQRAAIAAELGQLTGPPPRRGDRGR